MPVNIPNHSVFNDTLKFMGYSGSDIQMINEIAIHASKEAMDRLTAVVETAPENTQVMVMLAALASLHRRCDTHLSTAVEVITKLLNEKEAK